MHGGETKLPSDWFETFHEYAVEYDMTQISFFVDGKMYNKVTAEDGAIFHDVPYYVILNTAIGGPWPKPVDSNTVFPTYHVIDYVRVAQQKSKHEGMNSDIINDMIDNRDVRVEKYTYPQ